MDNREGLYFLDKDQLWRDKKDRQIFWSTGNGQMIRLDALSDEHLNNCVHKIESSTIALHPGWRLQYLAPLHNEQARRFAESYDRKELEELEEKERHQLREI